jgi:hypothetical protein
MIRADLVAPSHEDNGCHNGYDIYGLNNTQQKLSANQAVGQKQRATGEPDQPGQNADPPRTLLDQQVMYLRVVGKNYKRRPRPSYNFHA